MSTQTEQSRWNNLDGLRLAFAATVMLFHASVLSSTPQLANLSQIANPSIAVGGFFVISGYLIFQSYDKSRGLADYGAKRARRILPAYVTVILAIALGGVLISEVAPAAYFGPGLLRYLAANLTFLNFLDTVPPGVFLRNPIVAADGALWTIKVEVMFYFAVPLLAWLMRRLPKGAVLAALYLLSYAYFVALSHAYAQTGRGVYDLLAKQLPGQMSFFAVGAAIYYYQSAFRRRQWTLTALGLCVVGASWFGIATGPFYPAALGVAVMGIAFGPYLGNAGRFGDLSYGLYIWHFPILQLLVMKGLFRASPWGALALGVMLALVMAFLSWHLVEKRFLKRSSHYRRAEKTAPAPA